MAFNSNDLYTVSGGVDIFNYWNPFVTKHDSSSFYNWEQDNLPLYDLEERTFYLWEKFGYPLSGVPSMALLVSSTIPTDTAASANVFTSVSAAIESLPEIIRMPTLIEVAVSGHIGPLDLNNIKCEDDGALEIINRGFAPLLDYAEVSGTGAFSSEKFTKYSSGGADTDTGIPNIISAIGPIDYITNSSALSFSANTSSLFNVDGTTCFSRTLAVPVGYTQSISTKPHKTSYSYAGVGNGGASTDFNVGNLIYLRPISPTGFGGSQPGPTDSTINDWDIASGTRTSPESGDQFLNGIITANRLSRIKLENCDGPIYVRGFIVDGYDDDTTSFETATGIGVYNSTNVSLVDCGAMRCTESGYEVVNSKVNLSRRNVACRNYDTAQRGLDTYNSYGFKIVNSDVTYQTDNNYSTGVAAILASHFHTYGIYLSNSTLHGGDLGPTLTSVIDANNSRDITPVEVGHNNIGVYCDNSKYDIKGCSDIYSNDTNVKAIGSEFRTGKFIIDNGQEEGLDFSESRFILNTDFNANLRSSTTQIWNSSDDYRTQLLGLMSANRRHMRLTNGSYYGPDYPTHLSGYYAGDSSSLANVYNRVAFAEATGTNQLGNASLISPIVINNSRAEMPATVIKQLTNGGGVAKGCALLVENNSVCKLIGFRQDGQNLGATVIEGPKTIDSAAVVSDNNSTVFITGPTAIYQFGVGLLADNNSTIKACPVLDVDNNSYDGSGWGRMNENVSTALEIHSLRAGAVANNGSQLRFEDLGNYLNYWPDSSTSSADYDPLNTDASSASSIIAAGCLQFYPNPVDTAMAVDTLGSNFRTLDLTSTFDVNLDSDLSCLRLLYNGTGGYGGSTEANFRSDATRGGVCVLATGDSEVFVRNVHFPAGQYNGDESFYDPSASIAGCNDLFIWNIQDTSRLNASYATVSGVYPSLAGYTGPRAAYASGSYAGTNEGSAVSYAAYSGTPDTGTISVLDHFGSGVPVSGSSYLKGSIMSGIQLARTGDTSHYGPDSYENRGPFRLYFSVNPEAKVLAYKDASSIDTRPYQHLAQGYALSGEVSASLELSTIYQNLYNVVSPTPTVATMSGWYFPDSIHLEVQGALADASSSFTTYGLMPNNNPTQVLLDESFANTINNAKHCNTSYSGRKRLVQIYKAVTTEFGEAFPGSASGFGQGFRSTNLFDFERDI